MSRRIAGVAAAPISRHRFNVDEYYDMARAGVFSQDDRVELLEGEVVDMTPIGPGHAKRVKNLNQVFSIRLGVRALVSVQDPIRLGRGSEPQPDIALLAPRQDLYGTRHPGPEDVLLVVEVADSTVEFDRQVKIPLYARHGIPEAWLVNLVERRIEVYREPSADGYKAIRYAVVGDTISPLAFPDLMLKVDEILM